MNGTSIAGERPVDPAHGRRPTTAVLGGAGLLVTVALLATAVVTTRSPLDLSGSEWQTVARALGTRFPDLEHSTPIEVLWADPRGIGGAEAFETISASVERIGADPEVAEVVSVANAIPEATIEQARAFLNTPLSSSALDARVADDGRSTIISITPARAGGAEALVGRLRTDLLAELPGPISISVGGDAARAVDARERAAGAPPVALVLAVPAAAVSLLLLRRRPGLPSHVVV